MARKESFEERCRHAEAELTRSQARLAELEERGNDAVSAYDLSMGYDAEFNKQLKRNHIVYWTGELEPCRQTPRQQTLFESGAHPELQAAVDQGAEHMMQIALDAHLESDYDERNGDLGDFA